MDRGGSDGPGAGPTPARRARVLVVDDEELVRNTLARVLRRAGHEAIPAARGGDAVALFAERWREVDAVILDMVLPDLGGLEVLRRLRAIASDVPVILSSGYGPDGEAQAILDAGEATFLEKPFTLEGVEAAVARALSARAGG